MSEETSDSFVLVPIANSGLRRVDDLLTTEQRRKLRDDLIEMERCRRQGLAFASSYVIGGADRAAS